MCEDGPSEPGQIRWAPSPVSSSLQDGHRRPTTLQTRETCWVATCGWLPVGKHRDTLPARSLGAIYPPGCCSLRNDYWTGFSERKNATIASRSSAVICA
jgi:hypothetical protein